MRFRMKGQKARNFPHQIERIVAVEEALAVRLVGKRKQFGRRLPRLVDDSPLVAFDQSGYPLWQSPLGRGRGRPLSGLLRRFSDAAFGQQTPERRGHRSRVFAGGRWQRTT